MALLLEFRKFQGDFIQQAINYILFLSFCFIAFYNTYCQKSGFRVDTFFDKTLFCESKSVNKQYCFSAVGYVWEVVTNGSFGYPGKERSTCENSGILPTHDTAPTARKEREGVSNGSGKSSWESRCHKPF